MPDLPKPKLNTRNLLIQIALASALIVLVVFFSTNYLGNIAKRNIGIGFDFLGQTAGFSISQTLIPYDETDTFGRTFLVGLLNTILVSGISIVFASILGFAVGLFLLSQNNLIKQIARGYVELLRNIPPLLHVLFWYQVVFLHLLPDLKESIMLGDSIYINVRGITMPEFLPTSTYGITMGITLLGIVGIGLLSYFQAKLRKQGVFKPLWIGSLLLIVAVVLTHILLKPFNLAEPILGKFNFTQGMTLRPELFSIVIALSTYTSTYIAEIVRSSIANVPKGQLEAAMSLGFGPTLRMRLVIIPQAIRTMIPPATNQFLNIVKNSSLGIAIAYPDLTAVFAGTTLNQTGKALEVMIMVMFTYLSISLLTSFLMNWYNKKILDPKGKVMEVSRG